VELVLERGSAGVVFGALTVDGAIDTELARRVVHRCGTVPTVFHRAFDQVRDQETALELLVDCGVTRVLTSGGAPTALAGADRIGALVRRAAGRIDILAGGGVRSTHVVELVSRAGVDQIHARATEPGVIRQLLLATAPPSG
jgi:copper homeostasis protein